MSRAFRTPAYICKLYGFRDPSTGEWTTATTAPIKKMVNLQPLKGGNNLTFNETGHFYTEAHKIVYVNGELNFPDLPEGQQDTETAVLVDDKWYKVMGSQEWSMPGNGPKHIKLLCTQYNPGQEPDIASTTIVR